MVDEVNAMTRLQIASIVLAAAISGAAGWYYGSAHGYRQASDLYNARIVELEDNNQQYLRGYEDGQSDKISETVLYQDGFDDGYEEGYEEGYSSGYNDCDEGSQDSRDRADLWW